MGRHQQTWSSGLVSWTVEQMKMIPLPRTNPSQRADQLGILMRSKFHIFNIYLIRHSSVSFTPPRHPCNLNCSRAVACVVNTLPWWTPFTRCWGERGLVNSVHVDVPSNPIKPKERFISKCFDVQVQRSPGYSWSVSFIGGFYGGDELRVLVLKTQRVVTAQG